jgi:hypothetical protein
MKRQRRARARSSAICPGTVSLAQLSPDSFGTDPWPRQPPVENSPRPAARRSRGFAPSRDTEKPRQWRWNRANEAQQERFFVEMPREDADGPGTMSGVQGDAPMPICVEQTRRRIKQTDAMVTTDDMYYSTGGQVLQHISPGATANNYFSSVYVNADVARDVGGTMIDTRCVPVSLSFFTRRVVADSDGWKYTGVTEPNTLKYVTTWMNDPQVDYVFVAHSQGANIAMSVVGNATTWPE